MSPFCAQQSVSYGDVMNICGQNVWRKDQTRRESTFSAPYSHRATGLAEPRGAKIRSKKEKRKKKAHCVSFVRLFIEDLKQQSTHKGVN